MRKIIKTKAFIGAFLAAYFLYFLWIWFIPTPQMGDVFVAGFAEYGFPFVHYSANCFGFDYHWAGLIGNIFFGLIVSFIAGFIVSFVWQELPPE
jgi:hypothetical protein